MAFEDFLSSIGNIFTGGNVGQTPPFFPQQDSGGGGGAPGGTPPFVPTQEDSGIGKYLMPLLLGGGTMLASKLMGREDQANIDKAMKNLSSSAGASDIGRKMLDRASAGKLTDPQQAQVDAMKKEQSARNQQYLASLGIPVSTAGLQMENKVSQDAVKFSNDLINQSFDQGIKAMGLGSQSAAYLLNAATKSKTDLANTIGEVAAEIGRIYNAPAAKPKPPANAVANVPAEWMPQPQYAYMDPFTG